MDSDKKPEFFCTTQEVLARPIREHLFTVASIAAIAILARTVEAPDAIKELIRLIFVACVVVSVVRHLQLKRRWQAKQSEQSKIKASEDQIASEPT